MNIEEEIADILAKIEDGELEGDDLNPSSVYILLSRAAARIDSLKRENRDLKIDKEDLQYHLRN